MATKQHDLFSHNYAQVVEKQPDTQNQPLQEVHIKNTAMVDESNDDNRSRLFIVDGYGFLFRTYYSIGDMFTSNNTPIGGVFGFVRAVLTLIERHGVQNLTIALDTGGKTFRTELYPQYKANRIAVPETLLPQFEILQEFLEMSQISFCKQKGYEADDIIATMTRNASSSISIVSTDKDLMQLVDNRVVCLDFFKNKTYQEADVIAKFGVRPEYIVDYLALIGDASDNIPGVKGCGPKGAIKLIEQFGTVENIIINCNNILNEKTRNIIQSYKQDAILSKRLASLHFEVPLPEIQPQIIQINTDAMRKFLEKYEMKAIFYMQERLEKTIAKQISNSQSQLF